MLCFLVNNVEFTREKPISYQGTLFQIPVNNVKFMSEECSVFE